MPTYTIDVMCFYEDTVEIEAEDRNEAIDAVEANLDSYVVSRSGYSLPWDNIEIIQVTED